MAGLAGRVGKEVARRGAQAVRSRAGSSANPTRNAGSSSRATSSSSTTKDKSENALAVTQQASEAVEIPVDTAEDKSFGVDKYHGWFSSLFGATENPEGFPVQQNEDNRIFSRGDSRIPEEVFDTGFEPQDPEGELVVTETLLGGRTTTRAAVSMSTDSLEATEFANGFKSEGHGNLYTVVPEKFIQVGNSMLKPGGGEALTNNIPPERVLGAEQLLSPGTDPMGFPAIPILDDFQVNPAAREWLEDNPDIAEDIFKENPKIKEAF